MRLAAWMEGHQRFTLLFLAALAVAGAAATLDVPVALFPHIEFPRVVINVDAGDRAAERMAIEVTRPIEEALTGLPGVRHVRSRTSRGGAEVSVGFGWGDDMVSSLLQVDAAIAQVSAAFPEGTQVEIRRMDPTVFPVLGYSMTSEHRSLVELRELARYQLGPALSAVDGVASVAVLGGDDREVQVWVDSERLTAFGLTPEDVARAIQRRSVIEAIGRVEDHGRLYLVITDETLASPEQIGRVVVRSDPSREIRVADIARVVDTTAPRWTEVSADGRDAVIFQVYQRPDANTVQIAGAVADELAKLGRQLPPDVTIREWYDQTDLILASAVSVRDAIGIGALLAALVVLVFLRNLRATLIAVVAVVSVLAATSLCIRVLGMSFNVMTLGGIAAAVGLVIDDAIVVVDHLVRRLDEPPLPGHAAAPSSFAAAAEFTLPLLGSSLATVVIFSPLALITGVTGAFFRALSVTMASALVVSFLVSWLGVPALYSILRRTGRSWPVPAPLPAPGLSWPARAYAAVMRPVLRFPLVSATVIAGPLVAAGITCAAHVGSGFMPAIDEGGFVLDYHAAWGTSLAETDRLVREVEAILRDTPEVATTSRRTGLQLGGALTEANEGDFFVRLHPLPRRPIEAIMDEVRERVERTVPGLAIEMALLMEDLIGDLLGVPQPIEVKLYSEDDALLSQLGPAVAGEIAAIDGVVDVEDGQIIAGNALALQVDEERAAVEGLSVDDVSSAVSAYLDGLIATELQAGPKLVGVRVVLPHAQNTRRPLMEELLIRAPDGHTIPLRRVAHFVRQTGQPQITHENIRRMTAITARLSGRDLGSAVAEVQQRLDSSGVLPASVTYRMGGLYSEQQEAFRSLAIVVASAALLVTLLLLFLYERVGVALAAIATTLLSLPAVFVGLWLTGTELNITALMGLVMIVGMATEVSIFYLGEVAHLRHLQGDARLVRASITRMRPIAMMNAAAILSLLPLALGIGEGAGLLTPLAIAIISGLAVQLPMGVLVLPCLLKALSRRWLEAPSGEGPASGRGKRLGLPIRTLLVIALGLAATYTARPAAAQSLPADPEESLWRADWPDVGLWELAAGGAAGVGALVLALVPEPLHHEPRWSSGILFDDAARDALALPEASGRRAARASDAFVAILAAYPLLVDGLAVPLLRQEDSSLALQLSLVNLEAFAFNQFLTAGTKRLFDRERPQQTACRLDPGCEADEAHSSFISGHASTAFTGAGLICAHHLHVGLYGSAAADRAVCAGGLLLATATGVLRVMADRHYASDVLMGAGVGLAVGWGLPVLLHYRHDRSDPLQWTSVRPVISDTLVGMSVTGFF